MMEVVDVLFAGVGGQGVLLASELLARAAFLAGFDVKKSEVHGMAQRGGSVQSFVRFGEKVFSPLGFLGDVDFIVGIHPGEGERFLSYLREDGLIIKPDAELLSSLPHPRTLNVALVGALSRLIQIEEVCWQDALKRVVPEKALELNQEAFRLGRTWWDGGVKG